MWQAEIRVDLGAIRANVARLRAGTTAEVMAVVKADGYGHGMVPAARAALRRRGHLARRVHPRRGAGRCGGPASRRRCWPGCCAPGRAAARRRSRPTSTCRRPASVHARRAGRGGPPALAGRPGST